MTSDVILSIILQCLLQCLDIKCIQTDCIQNMTSEFQNYCSARCSAWIQKVSKWNISKKKASTAVPTAVLRFEPIYSSAYFSSTLKPQHCSSTAKFRYCSAVGCIRSQCYKKSKLVFRNILFPWFWK